ncbi:SPFH domain-containing protein [Acanthopleuribacter pedis]|uniref:Band 7 domain-containing protein n=1 Tax=Acanthopleuribacter pedis TaxID=442870 RepID=A0A8J7U6X6_9BACT|nr:SPFH domain-containing protein [Acanthopleuribacter pedis]MBO1320826.1 hypothetical protein [Acanthopleuribacter pedis]
MIRKITVHQNQLVLVFRNGVFNRVLQPGTHFLNALFGKETYRLVNTDEPQADFSDMKFLFHSPLLEDYLEVVNLKSGEHALVWIDDRLHGMLKAGRYGFWKAAGELRVERFTPNLEPFTHAELETLLAMPSVASNFAVFEFPLETQTILYHNRLVRDVLGPSRHVYWRNVGQWEIKTRKEATPLSQTKLIGEPALAEHLESIDLQDNEAALVWLDNRLHDLLGAGNHAMWRSAGAIRFERLTVNREPFRHKALATVLGLPNHDAYLEVFELGDGEKGLLTRDGEIEAVLEPGTHIYWRGLGKLAIQNVSVQEQVLDLVGQEMMTIDKVSLRMNIIVSYRIADVLQALSGVQDIAGALYRQTQLILRTVVGSRTLDELLTDKTLFVNELEAVLKTWAAERGLVLVTAGIRDIILPGEMKSLLNQVTEAKKRAEAELIRRREETASARSQANTARLFAQNPTLMRLRELEAVETIMEGSENTFLFGNGAVLDQIQSKFLIPNE